MKTAGDTLGASTPGKRGTKLRLQEMSPKPRRTLEVGAGVGASRPAALRPPTGPAGYSPQFLPFAPPPGRGESADAANSPKGFAEL